MSISLARRPSRRKRRKSTIFGSCLTILVILVIYCSHGQGAEHSLTSAGHSPTALKSPLLDTQARFWRSMYHIILNNDPQCRKPPDHVIPEKLDIAFESDHIHNRPDVLWMDDHDVQRMKIAHQNFLNEVQLSHIRLVYQKGTRGIVTTVSDPQIPILLIQLRMLRSAGSVLPVEVFLAEPTPYTSHICNNILSSLNATCAYYSDIFTAAGTGVGVTSYQYKILAILFSSFDELLLLDCDAWPVSNPDHLFTYPPFTETGLVLWPDFWYASESPYYFSIAKIENPYPLHAKPAIESGEMMYAKSKHERSIMLAAYYNYYGPEYYYLLQSQGGPGQGDKETFGSAALALKENFYWVKTKVTAIGRTDSSGHFFGSAMVQYDPIVDFQHRRVTTPSQPPVAGETYGTGVPQDPISKPMFIHANHPKFDPRTILSDENMGNGLKGSPPHDSNGTWVRCWDMTADGAVTRFGYDIERRFWTVIQSVACDDLVGQGDTSRKSNEIETCRKIEAYVRAVFGASDTPQTGDF